MKSIKKSINHFLGYFFLAKSAIYLDKCSTLTLKFMWLLKLFKRVQPDLVTRNWKKEAEMSHWEKLEKISCWKIKTRQNPFFLCVFTLSLVSAQKKNLFCLPFTQMVSFPLLRKVKCSNVAFSSCTQQKNSLPPLLLFYLTKSFARIYPTRQISILRRSEG